ncbi:MAG: beta-ketoacyl reductase, partial [Myxococcota bacterium]|nr:beta-ketoacyl reductase [Myxococcota bacterium]
ATYLITGGFGGLGLLVSRWLVEHGARTLVLLGRRPEMGLPEIGALQALGARVIPVAADLSDAIALETIRGELGRDGVPPLRGIVHCAADLSSAPIESLSRERISRMLGPKLRGTLLLEQASRGAELDFFVLFSSTTALLGASGLAHYAAANAFLDAFAEARRGPLRSVNWGTWQAMRLATAQDQQSYRQGGLLPMATEDALDALGRVIAAEEPGAVVANIDWSVLKPLYEARRPRRFLDELGRAPAARVQASGAEPEQSLAARLAGIPPEMRRDVILDFVVAEVAAVLGAERNVELDKGLFELGMDSLMSVELKKRLERGVSRPLPSTLTFNYPNVNALTSFLEAELGSDVAAAAAAAAPVVEAKAPAPSADLDELSVDELAARLRASLEGT